MSIDANKELVRRAWVAWATFDAPAFANCMDPNWRDHDVEGNVIDTLDRSLARMELLRIGFTDGRIEIHDIFGEGDRVATFVTITATHSGTWRDVGATGRTVRERALSIHRIADGRILESLTLSGSPSYYEQVGGRPQPT